MSIMLKNLIALVVAVICVHLVYVSYIWPQSDSILQIAQASGQTAPRHIVIVLKDYEQEICLMLLLWGVYLIISKLLELSRHKYLFDVDFLENISADDQSMITIGNELDNQLDEHERQTPLIRTLQASIRRYMITKDVQNTSDAIQASVEALAVKLEAENSMIRYLVWAIPSIGFIGTVRGIGQALSQADQALAGDITGMTNSLGIAFNSTFVALLISMVLMFLLTQLQRLQDDLVVDTQEYCEKFLLARISERPKTVT